MSKWAGHVGPTWAAQITPTVYVYCPFSPCGAQSSFAPWHPSGTHLGHVVQVGFWYMGPMWAAPDLSHVGFWYMGPMWAAPDLSHVGFWHMGPIWEAPDLPHVGFWYMGPMWAAPDLFLLASGIWDPCGKPQIYPMWASVYLLTLGLVVTDCYLKYMYQTICEIDPCLIIEQNQHFVNVPNF